MADNKRYKCEHCHGFLVEIKPEDIKIIEIHAYCPKCGKIVKGVLFKNKRPRI